ncbi:LysR family transcriptional regulator [Phaeobacter inhibens]|uniref:LysR family transcriptional regulator n=1 Tax=Phaeobacter inhibens TaxID=221822 RepID=UPI00016331C4|nr:LysR family transcriptional regulator [Phaeobacter inhibens]AFO92186.1 putative transcriptional regulator, LysR family [Phaeobacter inhibens DSM 17395]AUQ46873.1 putative transcriptional regulator, LysR family [Phaeobacter inhibens]AUQ63367.1 putative transcriptional regulator, LysR family [Phaeobacter inhibens]AUQ83273.1 putative transcriptional regulator, LysR family [Phaeobacter inhibens]AUQ91032.1 putative transcriptional regulator, LysR family [Phaeobacter inhibens]
MDDLTPLRYFRAAYELGTFSAAARACDVRQPSVSAAIARLEDRYDGPLFHRSRDGLTPTALGHELYSQAGGVLAQVSQLEARLKGHVARVVRVYCAPDVMMAPFDAGLARIRRAVPRAQFQFTDDALQADLQFVAESCLPRGCGFHPLWQERYGLALHSAHPLLAKAKLTLADLAGEALIARPYCPSADRFLTELGQEEAPVAGLRMAASAIHDAQLMDLVAAGLGVALMPISHGEAQRGIVLREISDVDPVTRVVGVGYRKTGFAGDMARHFLNRESVMDAMPLASVAVI